MSAHAFLSASGSKIWLTCTPAARAQEAYPDLESVFSREGTFGHGLAGARLNIELNRDKGALNTWYNEPGVAAEWSEFYNTEFAEHVEGYVQRCLDDIKAVLAVCPDAVILMEQRLDFSRWVPNGFGTGDLVIVADRRLRIRDLKLGKGVRVDAEDNSQLMLYAAGALDTYGMLYDFDEIEVTIDQPRIDHLDTVVISRDQLEVWLDEYVRPRAQMAWDGTGEFVAGDHCGFCRARHGCAARAAHSQAVVALYNPDDDFKLMAPAMTEEQVAAVLPRIDEFLRWAKDLKAWALREAVIGKKEWPGLKLVAGRSVRKIVDQDALAAKLTAGGIPEAVIYERSLLGLTALEKAVGKKKFGELSKAAKGEAELVVKPPGKPKLVPESDKRLPWVPQDLDVIEFDDMDGDEE